MWPKNLPFGLAHVFQTCSGGRSRPVRSRPGWRGTAGATCRESAPTPATPWVPYSPSGTRTPSRHLAASTHQRRPLPPGRPSGVCLCLTTRLATARILSSRWVTHQMIGQCELLLNFWGGEWKDISPFLWDLWYRCFGCLELWNYSLWDGLNGCKVSDLTDLLIRFNLKPHISRVDKQPSGPCIRGSAKISRRVTLALCGVTVSPAQYSTVLLHANVNTCPFLSMLNDVLCNPRWYTNRYSFCVFEYFYCSHVNVFVLYLSGYDLPLSCVAPGLDSTC